MINCAALTTLCRATPVAASGIRATKMSAPARPATPRWYSLTFDPTAISFREILEVFFTVHDPTTLNRQGADVGTQYRSAIFYHSPEQKATAEQVIREIDAAKIWPAPIVTEVTPFTEFYAAEDYHQEYFARNPTQGYCSFVIAPKVAKFRKQYLSRLKK